MLIVWHSEVDKSSFCICGLKVNDATPLWLHAETFIEHGILRSRRAPKRPLPIKNLCKHTYMHVSGFHVGYSRIHTPLRKTIFGLYRQNARQLNMHQKLNQSGTRSSDVWVESFSKHRRGKHWVLILKEKIINAVSGILWRQALHMSE